MVLVGHLDTYTWYLPRQQREHARVWGPGAYDMKGGIAIILSTLAQAARSPHAGDISAILVPDEEHASIGLRGLVSSIVADAAVFVESTGLDLGVGQAGRVRATINTASTSHRDSLLWKFLLMSRRREPNIVGLAFAKVDAPPLLIVQRLVSPGEDARLIRERLAAEILFDSEPMWDIRESFLTDQNQPVFTTLMKHAKNHDSTVRPTYVKGWTEAGVLAAKGIPCIVFGPGGGGAHTHDEWVDVEQAERAVRILSDGALDFCA